MSLPHIIIISIIITQNRDSFRDINDEQYDTHSIQRVLII